MGDSPRRCRPWGLRAMPHAVQLGSELAFRLYYLFGALAVAPVMGLGSLYLVLPRRIADRVLWVVSVVIAAGAVQLFAAPVDRAALPALSGASGQGVLVAGPWLAILIVLNLFGTIAVPASQPFQLGGRPAQKRYRFYVGESLDRPRIPHHRLGGERGGGRLHGTVGFGRHGSGLARRIRRVSGGHQGCGGAPRPGAPAPLASPRNDELGLYI